MSESAENMEIEISPPQKEQDHHDDDTTPVSDEEADDEDEENDADQSESMIDTVPASPRFGETRQRSRKTVERIGMSPEVKVSKKFRPTPASGAGMKLGEISKIADKLYKVAVKDDALKRLHRILYGSDGTATGRKKEIRLWNGTRDDAVKASMMTGLSGAKSVQMLKDICGYLSLATGGDRASLETRIFEFLVHPTGSTDPVKTKTKKRKSKKSEKKKTTREQSSSSEFSAFLKTRMPEVMAQAAGSMSAQNITELLTFEWKNMSESDRNSFGQTRSTKPVDKVQKVIAKSPKSEVESDDDDSDNSSSDSSSSGSSGSSDSSSSSSSDESP